MKKRSSSRRRPGPFASALIAAVCCGVVVIALWAPVARAQLILSELPVLVAIATAWFRPQRPK